jgi:hypothetical protein
VNAGGDILRTSQAATIERPDINQRFSSPQDVNTAYNVLLNTKGQNISNVVNSGKLDSYNLATYFFNIDFFYPFTVCDRCKSIQYFAFRVGRYYLTAKATYLQF